MKAIRSVEDDDDYGEKLCKCSACGIEAICTPSFDFYTTPASGNLLVCEICFRKQNDIAPPFIWTKRGEKEQ